MKSIIIFECADKVVAFNLANISLKEAQEFVKKNKVVNVIYK